MGTDLNAKRRMETEDLQEALNGKRFQNFVERPDFAAQEVTSFLKARPRITQLTDGDDGVLKTAKHRVIYEYHEEKLGTAGSEAKARLKIIRRILEVELLVGAGLKPKRQPMLPILGNYPYGQIPHRTASLEFANWQQHFLNHRPIAALGKMPPENHSSEL